MLFHSDNLVTDEILTEDEVKTLNRWLVNLCHESAGHPDRTGEGWQQYLSTDVSLALESKSQELAQAYDRARAPGRVKALQHGRILQSSDTWEQLARENPKMIGLAFELGAEGFTKEPK